MEKIKTKKVKIAIVGIGAISGIYLKNITQLFRELELVGIYDLIPSLAEDARKEYNVTKIYNSLQELMDDEQVQIVLNLTRPAEHFKITKALLEAGKHVYSEKPLAETYEEGKELLALAKEKGLLLGGAPDTFLGAGIQTCRKLIDSGFIGEPIGAAAFMICHGHESWHPNPEFYYANGGGPMMDMGSYYITALVNLLGGVSGVMGMSKISFPKRTITSEPKYGKEIDVEVPTYVTGIMNFDNGAIGTIFTTFDVYYETQARLEIYGSQGTLIVPDPNTFGGSVKLLRPEDGTFKEIPLTFSYSDNSRGLGLADMAKALSNKGDFRANGDLTLHVIEILTSFEKSSQAGAYIPLESQYTLGSPMKNDNFPFA